MLTRRTILQALPFIGAAAGIPALSLAEEAAEPQSLQERIDHHVAALAALISETAGDCNGWRVSLNCNPADHDGVRLQGERWWTVGEMVQGRQLPLDRAREFDPRTGLHNDCKAMPDLAHRLRT
jgi:hypothetical protein